MIDNITLTILFNLFKEHVVKSNRGSVKVMQHIQFYTNLVIVEYKRGE